MDSLINEIVMVGQIENKWEKYKKTDKHAMLDIDELIIIILGCLIFIFNEFNSYRLIFLIGIIVWYWIKIRFYEGKIIESEKQYYNVYFEKIRPVTQHTIDAETENAREPMRYDLKILEHKRKFLVDKFIIVNLIILVLIQVGEIHF